MPGDVGPGDPADAWIGPNMDDTSLCPAIAAARAARLRQGAIPYWAVGGETWGFTGDQKDSNTNWSHNT